MTIVYIVSYLFIGVTYTVTCLIFDWAIFPFEDSSGTPNDCCDNSTHFCSMLIWPMLVFSWMLVLVAKFFYTFVNNQFGRLIDGVVAKGKSIRHSIKTRNRKVNVDTICENEEYACHREYSK